MVSDGEEEVYILEDAQKKSEKDKYLFYNFVNGIKAQKQANKNKEVKILSESEKKAKVEEEKAKKLEAAVSSITSSDDNWIKQLEATIEKNQSHVEIIDNDDVVDVETVHYKPAEAVLKETKSEKEVDIETKLKLLWQTPTTDKLSTPNLEKNLVNDILNKAKREKGEIETKLKLMWQKPRIDQLSTQVLEENLVDDILNDAQEIEKKILPKKNTNKKPAPVKVESVEIIESVEVTPVFVDGEAVQKQEKETDIMELMKKAVQNVSQLSSLSTHQPKQENVDPLDKTDTDNLNSNNLFHHCENCIFKSKSKVILKEHIKSIHSGEVRFQCSVCDFKSYFKFNVAAHQTENHSSEESRIIGIGCEDCKNELKHIKCDFLFKDGRKNEEEMQGLLSCEECEFSAKHNFLLQEHIRSVHKMEVRYSCCACDYKSYHKKRVAKHAAKIHKDEAVRVVGIGCETCADGELHGQCDFIKREGVSEVTKEKTTRNTISVYEKPVTLRCKDCPFETIRLGYYHNHKKLVHDPGADLTKVLNCDSCEFQTGSSSSLENHKKAQHLNILKYYCNLCDFKSYYGHHVNQHISGKHKGEEAKVKRMNCPDCESNTEHIRCFIQNQKLIAKQEDNDEAKVDEPELLAEEDKEDEKPNKLPQMLNCTVCEYKSTKKMYLKAHEKLNHGDSAIPKDELLECKDCEFQTKKAQSIRLHKQSVHDGEVRYACEVCTYKVFFRQSIERHIEMNHKESGARYLLVGCLLCKEKKEHTKCKDFESRGTKLMKTRAFRDEYNEPKRLGKRGFVRNSTKRHMRKCEQCPFESFEKQYFNSHIKLVHGPDADPSKIKSCTTCEFETSNPISLRMHVRAQHLKEKRFTCSSCDVKSFYSHQIKGHIATNHRNEDTKCLNITCPDCRTGKDHKECTEIINDEDGSTFDEMTCDQCDYTATCQQSIKRHREAIHEGVMKFACSGCTMMSYDRQQLRIHITRVHKTQPEVRIKTLACDLCKTDEEHKCTELLLSDGRPKKFSCDKGTGCSYSGKTPEALKRHQENIHDGVFKYFCSACEYKSYDKNSVQTHLKKHNKGDSAKVRFVGCTKCNEGEAHEHESPKGRGKRVWQTRHFSCNYCDFKSGTTQSVVVKHMKSMHPTEKLFNCDDCAYKCNWLPNLKVHKRAMHDGTKYECDKCGWKTAWKPPFYEHMREKHGIFQRNSKYRKELELFESMCELCGFNSTSKRSMRIHMKSKCQIKDDMRSHRHKQKGPHKAGPGGIQKARICGQCGFEASSFYQLNTHKYEKHKTGQTNCTVCNLKVKNRFNLLIHMKLKHPVEGLNCDQCAFIADSSVLLKTHKDTTHEGITHPCNFCNYVGPNKALLHMHRMRSHSEQYLQCTDCDFRADNFLRLKAHRAEVHNNDAVTPMETEDIKDVKTFRNLRDVELVPVTSYEKRNKDETKQDGSDRFAKSYPNIKFLKMT